MHWAYVIFCGMCMGAADIVPGISGGTIAFIMGFYSQLINGIKNFSFRNFSENKFLLFLVLGISISLISLARFFDFILGHETYRVFLYSIFLGLILASVIICARHVSRWSFSSFSAVAIGVIAAFLLTGTSFEVEEPLYDVGLTIEQQKPLVNYDQAAMMLLSVPESTVSAMLAKGVIDVDVPIRNQAGELVTSSAFTTANVSYVNVWIIFCGALAVSAMLLPGISGSYLLTIFGVYPEIIGALADAVHSAQRGIVDIDAIALLGNLLAGVIFGALIFSRIVSWLLDHHKDTSIALLTGFMVGALGSVWPFWSYQYAVNPLKLEKGAQIQVLDPLVPSMTLELGLSLMAMLCGFGLVFLVDYLGRQKERGISSAA